MKDIKKNTTNNLGIEKGYGHNITVENNLDTKNSSDINEFQGWADNFNGEIISGWVISKANPLKPVSIDIFLCGIFILSTITKFERLDVTKIIRIPVKSGFSISINNADSKASYDVIDKLRKIKYDRVKFNNIFDLFVSHTKERIPPSAHLAAYDISVKSLIELLEKKHNDIIASSHLELKQNLLSRPITMSADQNDVKVIAYYLPQFHPFAENNEWWGDGFTEWTNVASAKSYFKGHYQPHLPADLGFYDLRVEETQKNQIDLAKRYGITGFCYYYYWFSGKTLMTMPIDRHLENGYDFDFCLCWANENWSRRWDGSENEILIGQQHAQEEDVRFIRSCIRYFKSKNYIKINGAPVIQIYRVSLIENCKEVIQRWKEIVQSEGFTDLHVTMVESFGLTDPSVFGCDSSSQFPPHGIVGDNHIKDHEDVTSGFNGNIYNYNEVVCGEIARPVANHVQFRGCMPSWDNTSRKGLSGNVFAGATPAAFETWLNHIIGNARKNLAPEHRFVFINAWNEWAEGAHLEPDRRNGHANLIAVRNALSLPNKALNLLRSIDKIDADVDRFIGGIINSNNLLANSLKNAYARYGWNVNWSASFARCDQSILKVVSAGTKNKLVLESLNGRNISEIPLITLTVEQGLVVEGIVDSQDLALWHSVPLFLSLKPISIEPYDSVRYVASIFDRRVASSYVNEQDPSQSLYWHGFSVTASLRNIPSGRYELELLIADTSNIAIAKSISANITVIIG